MKTFKIAVSIIFTLFLTSESDAQQPLKFDKIKVSGPATVELRYGDIPGIQIEDEENISIINEMYTVSEDGWLVISGAADDIVITTNSLKKIDISGSGKLESDGKFKTDDIELNITGSGKIELNLEAKKVKCVISGSGKIELVGEAEELNIDLSGVGKVDAENFKVKTCVADISGSGKCLVDVTDELTSNISGSGSIYYITRPLKLNSNVTGIGKISDAGSIDQDTTRITFGKKKVLIIDSEGKNVRIGFKDSLCNEQELVKSHWAGFEMGITMLMDKDFKNEVPEGYSFLDQRPEKSIAINFNLADYELKLYRRNIMLVTGLGFSVNNYRFNSDDRLAPDSSYVAAISNPAVTLNKNKLVTAFITAPLLLEFNTSNNPKKTFHFATGVIGGVRVHSHLKVVEKSGNNEVKNKIYDDFNTNPFRLDATVRVGYRNFTVFGSYGLTSFFKNIKDPELHALTMGVRLAGW